MTSEESDRSKCQSGAVFTHQEDKKHNYRRNTQQRDIKIVKDFAYVGSVINLKGDCS